VAREKNTWGRRKGGGQLVTSNKNPPNKRLFGNGNGKNRGKSSVRSGPDETKKKVQPGDALPKKEDHLIGLRLRGAERAVVTAATQHETERGH